METLRTRLAGYRDEARDGAARQAQAAERLAGRHGTAALALVGCAAVLAIIGIGLLDIVFYEIGLKVRDFFVAVLSVAVLALSVAVVFLGWKERAALHRSAAARYESALRDADMLELRLEEGTADTEARSALETIARRLNELGESAPSAPKAKAQD